MRGAVLLATAVTPLIAAVQPGQARSAGHEAKRCGIVGKGSADYRIKARKLTCRFAKRWSRAYLDRRSAAPGFDCYRAGTNVTFYCANGAKAYWAERLAATTATAHPGHGPVPVDVGGLAFQPPRISVGTGDTVIWVWAGPDLDHTVSAGPGQAEQFDSDPGGVPTRAREDSFSHRFTRIGTYTYFCRVHPDQMKGSVEVVELTGLGDTKRPRLTRVRVGPQGRRIAFTVSEGAILLLRIQRRVQGGWRPARDFDVFARKGRNTARLPLRGLAPGRYRVRVTAYDDADNASRPAFARLRI
jgi:plastocyanin